MNEKAASSWKWKIFPKVSLFAVFRWRILKRIVFVLACLFSLILLVLAEENWRGKRAWANYRREWEAKGEKFDLKSFIPAALPDDQNFTMISFLAPLCDFNPRPLKPGQEIWRDTNGHARAVGFGGELLAGRSNAWHDGHGSDLEFWMKTLRSNTLPAGSPFASRAEAGAELLKSLEQYRPVLDELQAAARERSRARFNINYDEPNPAAIWLAHLPACKNIGTVFQLRAAGELAVGRYNEALADTEMVFYMADAIKDEPFLISGLVRVGLLNMAVQPVRDGLADHRWSDAQLKRLQERLQKIDLAAECARDLRGERAMGNGIMDYLLGNRREGSKLFSDEVNQSEPLGILRFVPGGWLYHNQLNLNRMYQKYTLPGVDAANHRFYPGRSESQGWEKELYSGFGPYKLLVRLLFPAIAKAHQKFSFAQTALDQTAVACAIERYRLANGQFPATLDALSPAFINSLPRDVISGEPLKYRRTDDGGYVLYSVGWNQKDDGGTVGTRTTKGTNHVVDIIQGDWVWRSYERKQTNVP